MTAPPQVRDTQRKQSRQRIGSHYRDGVANKRRTPQHTVAIEDTLWADCLKIARLRHKTLTDEIKDFLVRYRLRHKHLLEDE
jgi:hypothetical protein